MSNQGPSERPRRPKRTLLEGGMVVTMNAFREVIEGDVLIEDDRIVAVGPKAAGRKQVDDRVDCKGRLVIPGLIQPHVHLCQTLFRGFADDLPLLEWLRGRIWPFEGSHTEDSLYLSATLGGAELLRSGTTSILDMGTVRHTDAVFRACDKLGLRATIGKAMMDRAQGLPSGLRETTRASIDESLALADRWHGKANGRLRYAFAPRFVLSCTEELMRETVQEARQRKLGLHTHSSENPDELDAVRERTGMSNVAYLHSVGMSGPDTVLAHCIWLTSEEQRILRETGTHVAHCPSSNLKLASGFAKIPDLVGAGVNVALAADGAPCNNNLDAFMEMRLAGLIHKPRFGAEALPAKAVLEMATLSGARALGLEQEIGSIEVGKKADITVVDGRQLHVAPSSEPYSTLVYACRGSDVEHVFVDGVQRVKRGKVSGVNTLALVEKASEAAREIVRIAGR